MQAQLGSHCLDCVKAARPDLAERARFWSAGQHNLVTMTLIGINVAVFVLVLLWTRDPNALTERTSAHIDFALGRGILEDGTLPSIRPGVRIQVAEPNQWYRLLTSGFLHYGVIHLALNCYFIYVLGPQLERSLGRVLFLALYIASLLGGSLGVVLLDSGGLSAGASGAAFGMMSAVAIGMWRRGVNPLSTGIGTVLILNVFITFTVPNISIGGHVGGAVAGAICGAVMLSPGHKPVPKWAIWATPVAVGVGSVVLSMLIVGAV